MRLTGAAMLLAAGLLAGLAGAESLRSRAALREELCRMLALMSFELERFRTPLPALFEKLAGQLVGPAGQLCRRMAGALESLDGRTAAEAWAEALTGLPAAERTLLQPLGSVLGRYGAREQTQAVSACRLDMEQARDRARTELEEKGRVMVGLSAAGAAMIAVLLL